MQKLVPSIWFNRNALEAAEFYTKVLPNTSIVSVQRYPEEGLLDFHKALAGEPLVVDIEVENFRISLTNADGTFAPNPSISFLLNFDSAEFEDPRAAIDESWGKLSENGSILMPLQEYDFSEYYGWCADQYGVNWQLMLTKEEGEKRPFVVPAMLFTLDARGRGADAREKYIKTLEAVAPSTAGNRIDYPDAPGIILYSDALLAGVWAVINDSTFDHAFTFNEGFSFIIHCEGQEQLDAVWAELAHQEQPCGWCKDEFGVSWQVVPANLGELMSKPGSFEKLMQMKKIEIDQF